MEAWGEDVGERGRAGGRGRRRVRAEQGVTAVAIGLLTLVLWRRTVANAEAAARRLASGG